MTSAIDIKPIGKARPGGWNPRLATALKYSPNITRSLPCKYRAEPERFEFEQKHLTEWLLDEKLWKELPEDMQKSIKKTQQAGACVLSSLGRLEKLKKNLPEDEDLGPINLASAKGSALMAALQMPHVAVVNARPNRPRQTTSYNCSPIPTHERERRVKALIKKFTNDYHSSIGLSSDTDSTDPMSPAARIAPPSVMSTVSEHGIFSPDMTPFKLEDESRLPTISRRESELALAPRKSSLARQDSDLLRSITEMNLSKPSNRVRADSEVLTSVTPTSVVSRGSYGTTHGKPLKLRAPKDHNSVLYYGELEQLRHQEITRLRHSFRSIRLAWKDYGRSDIFLRDPALVPVYEEYFAALRKKSDAIEAVVNEICEGVHFSLGWSDMPGVDKTYHGIPSAHEGGLDYLNELED